MRRSVWRLPIKACLPNKGGSAAEALQQLGTTRQATLWLLRCTLWRLLCASSVRLFVSGLSCCLQRERRCSLATTHDHLKSSDRAPNPLFLSSSHTLSLITLDVSFSSDALQPTNQEKDEEFVAPFIVGKSFRQYLEEMRQDKCYGTHVEIQLMSELYCRPVDVYQPQPADEPVRPLNTFQSPAAARAAVPIRLLYLSGNHYEALIDPLRPAVGVGLGIRGLEDAPARSVEQEVARSVMKESEAEQLDRAILQDVLASTAAESDGRVVAAAVAAAADDEDEEFARALAASEQEQMQHELEQQAIQQSLVEYLVSTLQPVAYRPSSSTAAPESKASR